MSFQYPHILIQKVGQCAEPAYASAESHDQYRKALLDQTPLSPNEGYTIKGFLAFPIAEEQFVLVGRYERNGEIVGGTFRSSIVTKHTPEKRTFETQNSVYRYEFLPEDEEAKNLLDKVIQGEL